MVCETTTAQIELGHRRRGVVQHQVLLLLQDRAGTAQQQIGVANRGGGLPKAERHRQLDADLPLLEVAADEVHVRVVKPWAAGGIAVQQVVAEAAPSLPGDRVELRQEVVLAGDVL